MIGPDVTRPEVNHNESMLYLRKFLQTEESNVVEAITFHQYYFNGPLANLQDFVNPVYFATFEWQLNVIRGLVDKSKHIWLGK